MNAKLLALVAVMDDGHVFINTNLTHAQMMYANYIVQKEDAGRFTVFKERYEVDLMEKEVSFDEAFLGVERHINMIHNPPVQLSGSL